MGGGGGGAVAGGAADPPFPPEIPLFHVLNARITFSNLCGCDQPLGSVRVCNPTQSPGARAAGPGGGARGWGGNGMGMG